MMHNKYNIEVIPDMNGGKPSYHVYNSDDIEIGIFDNMDDAIKCEQDSLLDNEIVCRKFYKFINKYYDDEQNRINDNVLSNSSMKRNLIDANELLRKESIVSIFMYFHSK